MIYVTGDMIIDEYIYGTTTRISPEAPVPIVNLTSKEKRLGGCANVYSNIKNIYEQVKLYAYIDKSNLELFSEEEQKTLIEINQIPVKTRVISDGHYVTRIDNEEYILEEQLEKDLLNQKFKPDPNGIFILSDYKKGSIKKPYKVIQKLKNKVLVDPKLPLDNYKGAYVLKPNLKEFEDFVGKCDTPKKLISQAQLLRDHLQVTYLIVTLGSEGVLLIGDSIEHYPAEVEEVFDVTGAGDTFMAGLALGLKSGWNISKATVIANKLAGISVSHKGTYSITLDDWNKVIKGN